MSMVRHKKNDLEWLESDLLKQFTNLKHSFLLREGGFSNAPFDSLNMGLNRGDDPHSVEKNHSKAKKTLSLKNLIFAHQVHKDSIVCVDQTNMENSKACDALMTNEKDIGLMVTHADCQAAIFFDPVCKALATVHCGWRGNVCNIYQKTINAMGKKYGSKPQNIHVAIGPSLGPKYAEFVNFKKEFPKEFWPFEVTEHHFDLWAIANWQLEKANILQNHIEIAKICTYENALDCFSYRRAKQITGVHATVAFLTSE